MRKREKKAFKRLRKKKDKKDFFRELLERLEKAGRAAYWTRMYRAKCERKRLPCPLDSLE